MKALVSYLIQKFNLMENTNENRVKIPVPLESVKALDVVFLSEEDDTPYLVLDKGTPFILIENQKTHFATLYRPTNTLYHYV